MLTTPAGTSVSSAIKRPSTVAHHGRIGGGLEHDGVARRQGGAELGQVDLVGDVPGGDGGHHAGGLATDPALRRHPQGLGPAQVGRPLIGLGQIGHPSQRLHGVVELGRTRHEQRRTGLGDGHGPQLVGVRPHGRLQLAQAPHPQGHIGGPRRVVEGAARRAEGALGISSDASAATPRTSSVAGLTVSNTAPVDAGTRAPSMSMRSSPKRRGHRSSSGAGSAAHE